MAGENLTIYKASAGSGKTYRLAYEFIKHVLGCRDHESGRYRLFHRKGVGHNRHRSVLAITFTNKATEEMKRRIVRELAVLAGAPLVSYRRSDYKERLIRELGCSEAELVECASMALTDLLFDFNFFNVSTIDAFFQTVLRVFAREAELNGNYEVEIADRYAIESGVNGLFDRVVRDADLPADSDEAADSRRLRHWLNTYMLSQINEGKSFSLFNRNSQLRSNLISFFTSLTGEDFKYHEKDLMEYIDHPDRLLAFERELTGRRSALGVEIRQLAAQAMDVMSSTPGFTSQSLTAGLLGTLRGFSNGVFKLSDGITPDMARGDVSCRFKPKPIRDGLATAQLDGLIAAALQKAFVFAELDIMAKQIYKFGLFGRVMREISEYRRDNNLILLSDTNSLLREIMGDNATPFVYERVGLWLRHFLIDEFQDTSGLQWDNLRPLVDNSLAEDNDNLIIGDEKQCIYRFRNSDPSLLHSRVQLDFPGRVRTEGDTPDSNTNYRSSATVVEFNNRLFTALAARFGLNDLYGNVAQGIHHKDKAGYVLVRGLAASGRGEPSFRERAVDHMLAEIQRELESGYSQSDIAILVRSNAEADFVIGYALERSRTVPELSGLQFLSDDALTIGSNRSVQQIVNRLHAMNRPAGASARGRSVSMDDYIAVVREADRLSSQGMSRSEAVTAVTADFRKSDNAAPRSDMESGDGMLHSLYSVVEAIVAELPESRRRCDTVFISAFQDEVLDFMSRGQSDLYSFLQWWESRKDKVALASAPGLDAIRIMTVHKSKGLEFPCVHLPLLYRSLRTDRDSVRWYSTAGLKGFDADVIPPMIPLASSSVLAVTSFADAYNKVLDENLVDELNVLYVAFTRAVNELIVTYALPSKTSKDTYAVGYVLGAVLGGSIAAPYVLGAPTFKASECDGGMPVRSDEPVSVDMDAYSPGLRTDATALAVCDDLPDTDSPRFRGNMLHWVLADVRHRSELPLVVKRLSRRGIVPRRDVQSITDALMRATADVRVRQWFEDYDFVANETTIYVNDEDSSDGGGENKRPDRVVIQRDGSMDVIDYKFGEVHTAAYHRQVQGYMELLRKMYPGREVRGHIWYVSSGHIDHVK